MDITKFSFSFLVLLTTIIRNADSQPLPEKTIPVHEIVTGSHFPDIVKLTRIVVDDVRKRAYFASSLSRYIGVINTGTLEMTSTIDTRIDGFVSRMLFLNPGNGVLYMFIIEQNLLYRIDPANGLVSSPISVHRAPAFDTVTNNLYISEAPDKIRIYNHQLQQIDEINGVYSTLGFDFIRKKMYAGYFDHGELDVFNLERSTDIENYNASSPKTFLLYQNYPNPFSARTTIGFRITDFGLGTQIARGVHEVPFGLRTNLKSHICLKVFDLLGREVATPVNGEVETGGHEFFFAESSSRCIASSGGFVLLHTHFVKLFAVEINASAAINCNIAVSIFVLMELYREENLYTTVELKYITHERKFVYLNCTRIDRK